MLHQYDLYNQKQSKLPYLIIKESWDIASINLSEPKKIVTLLNELTEITAHAEEYMYALALNTKNNPLGLFEIAHGSINSTAIDPREVFIRLLLCGTVHFVLIHNHPSGDSTPSKPDILLTKRIEKAGSLIGCLLLDHIIIGGSDEYCSMHEKGILQYADGK